MSREIQETYVRMRLGLPLDEAKGSITLAAAPEIGKDERKLDVVINPSSDSELMKLMKSSRHKQGNWIADPKTKKIYVWRPEDAVHRPVSDALGLEWFGGKFGMGMCGINKETGEPIAMIGPNSRMDDRGVMAIGNEYFNGILLDDRKYRKLVEK